jgi:hypothetical protein
MRIALGQINSTVGGLCGNTQRMLAFARAAQAGAEAIVFSEQSLTALLPAWGRRQPAQTAAAHNLPIELVRDIVNKVDRNDYKRRQAAPGLKGTIKAFGIGRRFPIAQRLS